MPRSIRPFFTNAIGFLLQWERWLLGALVGAFILSLTILLTKFYYSNTILVPAAGGTYSEGSIGQVMPLNPWFTVANDVNSDIVSLVFSGLLKYDPEKNMIRDDLATYEVSKDGKTYTVKLKDNIFWHDSTKESPHPVTAEDVVFTFKTIQDPDFPNLVLQQNFVGVAVAAVNDRTVTFKLDRPYSFFPSNLTLGLLPKKSFDGVPVNLLDQELSFGMHPVGAGPYRMKSMIETELNTEVTLEHFQRELKPDSRIERLIFRVFPDYRSLLSDIRNLDGIRLVPHTADGKAAVPRRFKTENYTLPQYVALFFNLDRKVLADKSLRLGLQLGTDKQLIANAVSPAKIVDTPLLEIDNSDWRYKFDLNAAQGALFESDWVFPEKYRLQRMLEQREANERGLLKSPPVAFLGTGTVLTLTGSGGGLSSKNKIQGIPLSAHPTQSGSWIVRLTTTGGSGTLTLGTNLIKLTDEKGATIDSMYVFRAASADEFSRATAEQGLIDEFLKTRAGTAAAGQQITVQDMYVENGFLRRRRQNDPVGFRTNAAGQKLTLTLLTSPAPESYARIAELVKKQWAALGVDVQVVVPADKSTFEDRLLKRDYDILLFGQSLLDNLDAYSYWHSASVQKVTSNRSDLRIDAYNLSQYTSFTADTLLEKIRGNPTETERKEALTKLQNVLKSDVPAVFLYSPEYTYAHREDILGIDLGHLSLHSDRFLTLYKWYVHQDRIFIPGKGWTTFFGWLSSLL